MLCGSAALAFSMSEIVYQRIKTREGNIRVLRKIPRCRKIWVRVARLLGTEVVPVR